MKKVALFFQDYIGTLLIILSVFFVYMFATDTEILDRYLFPQVGNIGSAFKEYWQKCYRISGPLCPVDSRRNMRRASCFDYRHTNGTKQKISENTASDYLFI